VSKQQIEIKMSGIEITVDEDFLTLNSEVMTLRDALDACRSSQDDLESTESSSGDISVANNEPRSHPDKEDGEWEVLYQDGATPLFKAIEEVNWREALRIVNESPNQARVWVKSTGTQNTTFDWSLWRRLPLHEVIIWFLYNMLLSRMVLRSVIRSSIVIE